MHYFEDNLYDDDDFLYAEDDMDEEYYREHYERMLEYQQKEILKEYQKELEDAS